MAIHVTPANTGIPGGSFKDATGWHVDDAGYLHITKTGEGNLATYHAGAWASVERIDATKASPTVINIHAIEDPAATAAAIATRHPLSV